MRAGRLGLLTSVFVAATSVVGCESLEPYRQGVHSTYRQELLQINYDTRAKRATDLAELDRQEAANDTPPPEVTRVQFPTPPTTAGETIKLRPPIPR